MNEKGFKFCALDYFAVLNVAVYQNGTQLYEIL
jgi:hypothetical protein